VKLGCEIRTQNYRLEENDSTSTEMLAVLSERSRGPKNNESATVVTEAVPEPKRQLPRQCTYLEDYKVNSPATPLTDTE